MTVLPFRRADSGPLATYTVYGKLPNRDDFVRVNAEHPVAREFDNLIQQSFECLDRREGWEHSYDSGGTIEFQFVSRDQRHIFLGILAPSRDRAGRRYPLVAGAILPRDSVMGSATVAPIAYEVFYDGLREQVLSAIGNSVEALSCRQFLETHLLAKDTAVADIGLAKNVVVRYLQDTPARRLDALLSDQGASTTLEQALLNLAFYRAFLRRFDNPATEQVILLPLASKGERSLVACAWLSILDALWQGDGGSKPWNGNYVIVEISGRAMLATSFGAMHGKFTSVLLGGVPETNARLDLCTEQDAWKNHRLYAEVSYALGRLLLEPKLPLETLRGFLLQMGKTLEGAI